MLHRQSLLVLLLAATACGGAPARPAASSNLVTITIIGTNDLHGHIAPEGGRGGVALLGGYVASVRRARAADGGAVLLIDGGDMFQGTLESNPNEGTAVVAAYNALGYDAAAIGNHEFDFGPAGALVVPRGPSDDPRGALRARAAEATFPFLDANTIDVATGQPLAGPNLVPSVLKEVAGIKVGIVGVVTMATPTSTLANNVVGLRFRPLVETVDEEVGKLRAAGAEIVILAAHSGLCDRVSDEEVVQECDFGEILDTVRGIKVKIDAVVAGHTHAGVIRRENGIPISEAWKYGHGFGRIDLVWDRTKKEVVKSDLQPPRHMVEGDSYEGAAVTSDPKVAAAVASYIAAAEKKRNELLGVRVESRVAYSYEAESALGNLVADVVRNARKGDVGISNGGGLRRSFDPGELTYGVLFETYPFDNRFATYKITGEGLRTLFTSNLKSNKGVLNPSGFKVVASCKGTELDVRLFHSDGKPIADDEKMTMVTSDFLVGGGMEGAIRSGRYEGLHIEETGSIREEFAEAMRHWPGGVLRGDDKALYDPAHPRLAYPGKRPVTCPR